MEQQVAIFFYALLASPLLGYVAPVWLQLLTASIGCIFVGSLKSVRVKSEEKGTVESVKTNDALKFPMVASGALLGLYVVVKLINKDLISIVLSAYFTLMGVVCINHYIQQALKPFNLVSEIKEYKHTFKIPYYETLDIEYTNLDFKTFPFAAVIGVLYFLSKHWILNNLIGICFSVYTIEHVSIVNVKVGAMMLIGLFFYDIFWVFGTDVMVTVAKNVDAPIKLLLPKLWADGVPEFSMLGLGDIIVPGIYIALLIRFEAKGQLQGKSTPIFNATMIGYVLGIAATMGIMYAFEAAQPALLYLVPACLITSFGTAYFTKSLPAMLEYKEEDDEAGESKEESSEKKEN